MLFVKQPSSGTMSARLPFNSTKSDEIQRHRFKFANYANIMVWFFCSRKHNCFLPGTSRTKEWLGKPTVTSRLPFFEFRLHDSIHCLLWHTIEIEHYIFIRTVCIVWRYSSQHLSEIGIDCKPQKRNQTHTERIRKQMTFTFIL